MPKFERVQMMKSLSPFSFWLMEDAGALQISFKVLGVFGLPRENEAANLSTFNRLNHVNKQRI